MYAHVAHYRDPIRDSAFALGIAKARSVIPGRGIRGHCAVLDFQGVGAQD